MKRTYIKPEMELLDSEQEGFLCASDYNWKFDNQSGGNNNNGNEDDIPGGGGSARGFGDFYDDEY